MDDPNVIRVILPLPDELVILEVPRIEARPRITPLEATQLPFPPAYDPSGQSIKTWPNPEDFAPE